MHVCECNSELVVRPGRHRPSYGYTGISVEIDQVSLIFRADGGPREHADIALALVRSFERIEHLLKNSVDAVIGLELGRLISQRRCQRKSIGREALVVERSRVVPPAKFHSTRQTL
jgi:hypothetical protein